VHSATIDGVSRRLAAAAAVLISVALVAGCGNSGSATKAPLAFCRAASNYDDRVTRNAKIDEQIRLGGWTPTRP
jgi:hypothetical protein